jgi:hypothetical protein
VILWFTQDNVRNFGQIASRKMRFLPEFLRIATINENRATPRGMTAVNVPPAVAHHPALREVNAQFLRRAQQHARLGLATIALRRALAVMVTDLHAVNRQPPAHFGVNGFDNFLLKRPATNIRLVGCDDQQETGPLELRARRRNLGKNLKFRYGFASRSKARLMTPSRSRKTARRKFVGADMRRL